MLTKKRNESTDSEDRPTNPIIPKELPPLRTFVVRTIGGDENGNTVMLERVVHAHGLAIDDARMVSFIVFFWVDFTQTQAAQANKLVLNSDAWEEIEEINVSFPTLTTH